MIFSIKTHIQAAYAACMLLLLFVVAAYGQPGITRSRTYGGQGADFCNSLIKTVDNGYAIVGNTFSVGNNRGMWLLLLDEEGEVTGENSFGDGYTKAVAQTTSGGFAISGNYTVAIEEWETVQSNIKLVSTNQHGDSISSQNIMGYSVIEAFSMLPGEDGGIVLAGRIGIRDQPHMEYHCDFFLAEMDTTCEEIWSQRYDNLLDDVCYSMIRTADGGYALAGYTGLTNDCKDFWFVRTNESGDSLWSKTYGHERREEVCESVIQTGDGGFVLVGFTTVFEGTETDFWLIRTDENGDSLWSRTYGGENNEHPFSVIQTPDGGFAIVGYSDSFGEGGQDGWLLRTDADGDSLWSCMFGGENDDCLYSVLQTEAGNFVLAGNTRSYGAGGSDAWLLETEEDPVHVGESETGLLISSFTLHPSYPNPFNSTTTISYSLPVASPVSLKVFDLSGREVKSLVEGYAEAGKHTVSLSGDDLVSGVYLVRMAAGEWKKVRKVLLVR